MKKLYFLCKWNKQKEKTWSGTTFALFSELQKYYDIEELNVQEKFSQKVRRKINKLINANLFREDFQIQLINSTNKQCHDVLADDNAKVFQFFETECNGASQYIYQDLCVGNILDLYNHEREIYKLTEFNNFSINDIKKRYIMQKNFYSNCAGVFTMGKWLANYLVDNKLVPADKVHAVGGGINIDKDAYKPQPKTRNRILFVGRNFERKGGPLVVEAFKKLRKEYDTNAELYIAGPSLDLWSDIDGVRYLGDISRNDLVKYYNLCDIFVMPSYFEAYGLVFGEALCFGLPCIARNKYAMPEFIQNDKNGYLIDSDDSSELAKKMYLLLKNEKIFNYVSENRENYIEEYSWHNVVRKINRVIN